MTRFLNTARKIALVLIVNLLLLEMLSFLVVHSLAIIRPNLRLDLTLGQKFDTLTDDDLASYWAHRDELLGWDRAPFESRQATNSAGEKYSTTFSSDGARMDPKDHDATLIATYGDSFTEGAEVNNDETWQVYLENLTGHDVKNFGVLGYGIGQSFLKLKRHLEDGRVAPITMLVIYSNDLRRAVNNYRWFLNGSDGALLAFKPSFRLIGGQVRFFSIDHVNESMTLNDLNSLAVESAKYDFWMQKTKLYFVPQWPYSYQIIRALPKIVDKIGTKFQAVKDDRSLWTTQEGRLVAQHIVQEFYTATITRGSIPVVLFIPDIRDWKDGRKIPPYHEFRTRLSEHETEVPFTIDIYEAEFDESRFSILPFQGHPSPYGNQVIASHVFSELRELNLIE
ncbi:MAG: hypothetical protein JSW21_03690 [Gammaproteobacteria bacterium]|nr:MAG: hypothetical protein JSW21_03690 [Gammaproteobacteria bacterium]